MNALERKADFYEDGEEETLEQFAGSAEYERVRTVFRNAVEAWAQEHLTEGEAWDQRRMTGFVTELATSQKEAIESITSQMKDRERFSGNRAALCVYDGNERIPRVVLYGWRKGDPNYGATDVHDHGDSLGAIHVLEGAVVEKVYGIDRSQWEDMRRGSAGGAHFPLKNIPKEMVFTAGHAKSFVAPYIHDVGGSPSFDFSASLHAYHPPLDSLALFEVEEGALRFLGRERGASTSASN